MQVVQVIESPRHSVLRGPSKGGSRISHAETVDREHDPASIPVLLDSLVGHAPPGYTMIGPGDHGTVKVACQSKCPFRKPVRTHLIAEAERDSPIMSADA